MSEKGPWGQSEPPVDEAAEKNTAIDQACRHIILNVLPVSEELGMGVEINQGGNETGNVAYLSFTKVDGDIRKLMPAVRQAVDATNRDFYTRNIKLTATAQIVTKSESGDKPAIIVSFISRK
ncbi:MAG: hypothetical protein AAB734_04235 [Patescibacteria group bacterium]